MGEPHVHEIRVRYAECDAQGVVFNSHYLAFFDISMTELWRAAFGSYQAVVERGVDIVVAEAQLRFRGAAHFDDVLALEVAVEQLGTTSIPTRHSVRRDEELLVEATMRHVMVDTRTLTKTPIPDWLRAGLAPWSLLSSGAGSGARADTVTGAGPGARAAAGS